MYIITATYARRANEKNTSEPFTKYFQKIEKAIGRGTDMFHTDGRKITMRWVRKSAKANDRILTILSKFRKIEVHYCEDGR